MGKMVYLSDKEIKAINEARAQYGDYANSDDGSIDEHVQETYHVLWSICDKIKG